MVRMCDVAKRAGVSIMTVSRVVNGVKGKVSEETRKKVLKIIKELNYYPNFVGRALHGSRLKIIGVISPLITAGIILENPFYYELIMGIEEVCTERGYDVMISTRKKPRNLDYFRNFYERKLDGIIIVAPNINTIDFDLIEKDQIPVVLVGERTKRKVGYVDADNEEGGFLAVKYLYEKGHRDIAIVTGVPTMRNSIDRLQGFKKGMKQYNLEVNEDWIITGNFTYEGGVAAVNSIMKQKKRPTAVFCTNDLSALGFINQAKKYGIKIPDDISVIGFDNISASQYSSPPLTTIKQPIFQMGKASAESLLNRINDREMIGEGRIFPVEIVERESVISI
ncbi:MAG: LacI family DNA-binding transcriptional regulator [Brevinematia bacterium]